MGWRQGEVVGSREGVNPDIPNLKVIAVKFENGEEREFASEVADHVLNDPPEISQEGELLDAHFVNESYSDQLVESLEAGLDVREVQDLLGHRNIQNTMIYTQISDKKRERVDKHLEDSPDIVKL